MSLYQTQIRNFALMLLTALLLAGSASAQTNVNPHTKVRVKNFGRINDHYYRGAQPESGDYPDLAGFGIKTVIDLTQDGRADEQRLVQRSGMNFYRIPLTTSDRPSDAAVTQFLKLVNDPANWPVYVHCQGGRHRTGVMTAVYRMTQDGWSADRAYEEMKQYHFEGFPAHPVLKLFVYDYRAKLNQVRQANTLSNENDQGFRTDRGTLPQ
jgi:protein tyrosine/serine phosphatase